MRRRDWAGSILVACLIALASQLRNHAVLLAVFLAAAIVSGGVVVRDVAQASKGAATAGSPRLTRPWRALIAACALAAVSAAILVPILTSGSGPHALTQLDLKGSLVAYNGTTKQGWAPAIGAAVTDPLRFRFRVTNASAVATPFLDIEALYTEPEVHDGMPWTMWMAVGLPLREVPLRGAYAQIMPQEGGLGLITVDAGSFEASRAGETDARKLYSTPYPSRFESPYGTVHAGAAAALGSLGPHETRLITFKASSQFGNGHEPREPFAFGGDTVRVGHAFASPFHNIVTAAKGDTLVYRIKVDSPFGRTYNPALVRVSVHHALAQHAVVLTAFAAGTPDEPTQRLGRATVSARNSQQITLSVVPRSTRLFGFRGDTCTYPEGSASERAAHQAYPRALRRLPEGVAAAGVEIGPVGGFRPRDACHGEEFTRWVQFEAHVDSFP
jgi:hypothetical protein